MLRPHDSRIIVLTKREFQIAEHLVLGLTNKQIAHKIGCSPLTLKNHVAKMLRLAQALNRVDLVALLLTGTIVVENWHYKHVPVPPGKEGMIEYDSWPNSLPDNLTLWIKPLGPGEEEYISWYHTGGI